MEEKKVYARAPEGCRDYIVAGKVYLTRPFHTSGDDSEVFEYYDEAFSEYSSPWVFASWQSSPHLNGGNWERLELTESEAAAINASLRDPLESHPDSEPDADQYTVGADTMTDHDTVNAPKHYASGEIECIDAIKASMTAEEFEGYCKGNVQKYMWRWRDKGGVESLRKAEWYLRRLIDVVE